MDNTEYSDQEDKDIARLLKLVGAREKLPDELKNSWELKFREELKTATGGRDSRRRSWVAGIAASVVLCAVALTLVSRSPAPPEPLMRVSTLSGSTELITPAGERLELELGMNIPADSVIRTGSASRAGIAYAGYTLRLDLNSEIELQAAAIQLAKGRLYASDSEQNIAQTQLNIVTPHGKVRDIGTQFTVRVDDDSTVATVRRGAIQVVTVNSEHQVEATPGAATRITVNSEGQAQTKDVAASGNDWQWIYAVSEPFQLEGKSIHQFLQWSVRESGRELAFASASAELYARRVRLYGSTPRLDPEQAITPVLEATDLRAQLQGDTLLVRKIQ